MCFGVIVALFTFILPRFAEMFDTMGVELPASTALMIHSATWARANALLLLVVFILAAAGLVLFLRSRQGQRAWSRFTVRVPLFGIVVRNVILAQLCRIWGQLLDSKVGLVEAVELTRQSTSSLDFQELLADLRQAITQGESIGPPLKTTWLLPRTFAAAIATGEESGRLADALLFVAGCLEEENAQVLASLTRLIEPLMLLVMGGIVGTAAVSLFLPMFDMAAQAGG
jgi:type IV pilus assembly protein PilC